MAKRQKEWARRKREELLTKLGSKCARCGATSELTFDCIVPMGHEHHAYDTSHRMSFYNAMLAVGNLQVLCATCNSAKGNQRTIRTPFIIQQLEAL